MKCTTDAYTVFVERISVSSLRILLPAFLCFCLPVSAQENTNTLQTLQSASDPSVFIDLQSVGNKRLKDSLGVLPNNPIAPLQEGVYGAGGTEFYIGEKLIHLGSTRFKEYPATVSIPVGRTAASLELLQSTTNGGYPNPKHPTHVPDGSKIGSAVFVYADGTKAAQDMIYGDHTRDFWNWDKSKPTKHAKIVWTGNNADSARYGVKLRLLQLSLKNPHPEKKIQSLVLNSNMQTAAAQFCLAVTVGK